MLLHSDILYFSPKQILYEMFSGVVTFYIGLLFKNNGLWMQYLYKLVQIISSFLKTEQLDSICCIVFLLYLVLCAIHGC